MIQEKMTAEQEKAHRAFKQLLQEPERADRLYDAIPDSKGGRIISTDLARFLDERYRDTPKGQPRDLLPGWDCAWRYAQDRFKRELRQRGKRQVVRFMAGGWAAGKTHALESQQAPDLAWDGTLRSPSWATKMISLAVEHGWKVDIAYVFRDLEMAIYGAVERAQREGRSVPLEDLPETHRAVQSSILELIKRYWDEASVSFTLVHNLGMKGIAGAAREISYETLAQGGALHYSKTYECYYKEAAVEVESRNSL